MIKPSTTASALQTKDEKDENEQGGPKPVATIAPSTGTHQSNGNKPHRQHLQTHHHHPPVKSMATSSNVSTSTVELLHQDYPSYHTTPPSELRLRQPSSLSPSSSHLANSSKESPPRQTHSSPLTSPASPSDTSAKSSVVMSSREKATTSTAKHPHSPPSVVSETDKLTGTYTVISKQSDEQPSSFTSGQKTDKPEKITLKKVEPPQSTHTRDLPQSVYADISPASGTPPNPRKLKPARRSGSKLQRSPQAPEPSGIPSPSPVAPASSVNLGQARVRTEGFIRKESESSIKSTDSESTSSSEKLDEREDAEPVASPEVESKAKLSHPVAKEPNTGQTVPVTPVSDTPDISDVKNVVMDVQRKDKEASTAAAAAAAGRGKGKKRPPRHQQKKEEKPKRRDRERDRDRDRDRDRERGREKERSTKDHTKQERVDNNDEDSKQQPASGESSSSNSTEQLYVELNEQRGESQEADDEKSDVSSIPERETSQKLELSLKPETPVVEPSSPQKSERPARKSEEVDVGTSPSGVLPVPAVPSTAFKTGRGKSTVVKQRSEEGHSEPVHRSTKKSSSRKTSDRSSKGNPPDALADKSKQVPAQVPVESPPANVTEGEHKGEEEMTAPIERPQNLPVIDVELSEGPIVSPDSGTVEADGVQHKLGAAKAAQGVPTSPHELAASLLSNNSAIRRRSRQHGDKGQSAEDGNEEGDYDEEDSEEGSDGDTQPAGSPAIYQPTPKHPRMDNSPHKLQGPPPPFHHGQLPPPMHHGRAIVKPPSTLSLDAEPFYPTNFSSKSRQGHHRPRMVDPQKYPQEYHHHEGPGAMQSGSVAAPPGFSPEDVAYMQQAQYVEKQHFKQDYPGPPRSRPPPPPHHHHHHHHHHHAGKSTTPSPPYNSNGQQFSFMDHMGMEPQEHVAGFHTPPTHGEMPMYDSMEDPSAPGYSPMGARQFLDQQRELPVGGGGGLETHLSSKGGGQGGRRVTPTGGYPEQYMASLHQQQRQQQQLGGGATHQPYRPSRGERTPSGFTVTGQRSLWENPNAYRLQPLSGMTEDPALLKHQQYLRQRSYLLKLYQQEQAALEAAVAREQAKRSAETLSSLNPPYRSRGGILSGKIDLPSPSGGQGDNLWEGGGMLHDPILSPQGFDDSGLSDSIMRQRQMHYLANQPPARSRTYSGDSEIGGEFVSNPVQIPSSIGHPGLNRAPGPGTSQYSDSRVSAEHGGKEGRQRSSLDHATSSVWPSRSEVSFVFY